MRQLRQSIVTISLLSASLYSTFVISQITPRPGFADSYSQGGNCYINSTFDHGAGDIRVDTPFGRITVREVANIIGPGPGQGNNPIYNDVQCGNGPPNNAGDEDPDVCPGRVDQGAAGCFVIGPRWNFDEALAASPSPPASTPSPAPAPAPAPNPTQPPVVSGQACAVFATSSAAARTAFANQCPTATQRDCDPVPGGFQCANYRLGSHPTNMPTLAQLLPADPTPAPAPPPPSAQPTPQPGTSTALLATGGNARNDIRSLGWDGPIDCDRINGVLNCANYQLGASAPPGVPPLSSLGGSTPQPAPAPTPVTPVAGTPAPSPTPTPAPAPSPPTQAGATFTIQAEDFIGQFNGPKTWTRRSELNETGMQLLPDTRVTNADLLIPGQNFWNFPDSSTPYLTYRVDLALGGTYRVETRALSRGTEDNGAHLWVNGSWVLERIQWCAGKDVWTYSSALRLDSNHCGVQGSAQVFLPAGTSEIRLGAREDGVFIDEIRFIGTGTTTVAQDDNDGNGEGVPSIPAFPGNGSATASLNFWANTINDSYRSGDFVSLHYDSSFDPDDFQAMILAREMFDERPDVDFVAINGTKTRSNNSTINGSLQRLLSVFPNGLSAFDGCATGRNFCPQTIDSVASMWQLTLQSGSRVHVAEGGPSSFTADVITELVDRGVSNAALKRIRVIQHSWGFNEEMTEQADLDQVRRYADYIRIANGNQGHDNGAQSLTADLNYGNESGSENEAATFRTRARNSRYGAQWTTAFNAINDKVDGSDAVELMWILGITRNEVPDMLAFANRFF